MENPGRMLFNSYTFLVFLAVAIVVSWCIRSWTMRKFVLLLMSYLFYAAWNPPFVALLWVSTIVDWYCGKAVHRTESRFWRRTGLLVSLSVNLGLLGFFKYGGFLIDNTVFSLQWLGIEWNPVRPDIVLPVGISFYTFQTLSYTLDIYKGHAKPWHSFLDYALYVTFFPQLVAGPIVRATEFLPQCEKPKRATRDQMAWGLNLFVIGLFAKVVIADALMAPLVEKVYDQIASPNFSAAWAGTLAFAMQIFSDFFGYSTCAIGVALMLGFALPDNFRFPYAAVGFSDFWRRWHISLSTWLRDYLYIGLGGSRKGMVRTYVNLMLTMLLGGLWHGASWMFVIWGGLHGTYLVVERLIRQTRLATWRLWRTRLMQVALMLTTFWLVCITWVFFRARTLKRAWEMTVRMLGADSGGANPLPSQQFIGVCAVTIAMLLVHYWLRKSSLEELYTKMPWWLRSALMALMAYLTLISFTGEEDRAFIYFQF